MKNILSTVLLILCGLCVDSQINAQQLHQLTQYRDNLIVFNPAVSGSTDLLVGKVGYRKQWAGFVDSPSTFFISAHTNFADDRSVGLGLNLFSDVTGPTRRQGGQLSYAYHIPIQDNAFLGLGIAATLFQYRIDFSALNAIDFSDVAIMQGQQSKGSGDINLGAFYHSDELWISLSSAQVIQTSVKFSDDIETVPLKRHYFAGAGYEFELSRDFSLEPSVFIKAVKGIPVHADFNARLYYDQDYWFGLGYRTQDAISFLLGLELSDVLNVSYSYDYSIGEIKNEATGSHEIGIGFRFDYRDSVFPQF